MTPYLEGHLLALLEGLAHGPPLLHLLALFGLALGALVRPPLLAHLDPDVLADVLGVGLVRRVVLGLAMVPVLGVAMLQPLRLADRVVVRLALLHV